MPLLKKLSDCVLKVFVCAAVVVGLFSTAALAQAQQEFFKINKSKVFQAALLPVSPRMGMASSGSRRKAA